MTKVCIIGTSLLQQGDAGTEGRIAHTARSCFRWAQRMSGWRVETPVWHAPYVVEGWEPSDIAGTTRYFYGLNCGVSGQTLDKVTARLNEIVKIPADEYHVGGVTNTISSNTHTAQELLDEVIAFASRIKAITGKKVVLYTVLARATNQWADPSDQRDVAKEYNTLLMEQELFEVYDWNTNWLDYTSSIDIPVSGNSPDGTHFGGVGAYAVGKKMAYDWIQSYAPAQPLLKSPTQVLNTGGFLQGTGGTAGTGVTGSVADGIQITRYTGTPTVAVTLGTASNIRGGVQNLVCTPSGVDESAELHFRTASANTPHTLPGKWVQGTVKVRINSANDTFDHITLTVDDQSTTGVEANDLYDTGDGFPQEATDGFLELRTPPLKLKSDSTDLRVRLEIFINGLAASDGDIDIAEFAVVEVPDPEDKYNTVCPNSRAVASGVSLSTTAGVVAPGTLVSPSDFNGDGQVILNMQAKGLLVEV